MHKNEMKMLSDDKCVGMIKEIQVTEQFSKMVMELEHCSENEQTQKIEKMIGLVEEMNSFEFYSVFAKDACNRIDKMIDEKKFGEESTVLLLKGVGRLMNLRNFSRKGYNDSLLCERIKRMILEEENKKEMKNGKYLADLCECFLFTRYQMGDPPKEFLTICVPCLLKVALNRKEDKDIQKEVEMALLALSSIYDHYEIERELYLNEIKEIIKYHQEHRNLTRLAYQSAWGLLVNQSRINRSLDDVVINELHFVRDAARELGELTKCVNLKREEKTEEIRQMNEAETIMMKWIKTVEAFYLHLRSWKEEYAELISYLAKLARAMRESEREIYRSLTSAFQLISTWKIFRIDAMRKCGVVDLFLEEIQQNTSDDMITYDCMMFYRVFSRRLRENDDEGYSEVGWEETKREVLQKMEEIGCEDIITSFQKIYASIL